jgi:2-amino-4-hydroxy-6-hydroxymethyldihydropteridine diphosphokinase
MGNHSANQAEAYIGLGANLDRPKQQLESALEQLRQIPEIIVQNCSSFYRSAPLGPKDQNDFINAAAKIRTSLCPMELLQQCQRIERLHGRVRKAQRWGPRILDLDILLYRPLDVNTDLPASSQWLNLDSPELSLPHPEIHHRAFVVIPLLELTPDLAIEADNLLKNSLEKLSAQRLQKLC